MNFVVRNYKLYRLDVGATPINSNNNSFDIKASTYSVPISKTGSYESRVKKLIASKLY